MLLCAVFDLPARSKALNMKQFNGEYGCLYCYDKGKIYNRARIYRPDVAHNLRTNKEFEDLAKKAERTGQAQYGIKGKAMLADIIELPQCIPPDYMHSILEGIFKQLMKYWFDSKFHSHPFSLRKFMNKINDLLLKIKSIKEIQRQPRPLDMMSFYKASEYRAWLLFYAFPIVAQFLPPEYSHHLSLLVSSLHILLSDHININDLDTAHRMLCAFYQSGGDLYSPSIYTANMHLLQHTVPLVRLWGPLWCYSMFGFENFNGVLGATFHGSRE